MKKISDDIAYALDKCAEALSINELSRVTGVRIELLRRFITRKTRSVRGETWDKIYPVLRPYLAGSEPTQAKIPVRIGRAYRRHSELIEMFSDQKILLDAFDMLDDEQKNAFLTELAEKAENGRPTVSSALTPAENQLMGGFLALDDEARSALLARILEVATAEVRNRRTQLF
ncbi:MAG: hypothetical protein LBM70_02760 [Victivallales bacterium]|jgi:hypothetical protein|nr:hypothetical protein [Victivallales bacterium]